MIKPVRILVVEDSEDDFLLLKRHLKQEHFDAICTRVETADEILDACSAQSWDIVICDVNLPHMGALDVIGLIRDQLLDIPIIIVSGAAGEDELVAIMRAGANDVFRKEHFLRLVPAIEREINEFEVRKAKATAELHLKTAIENTPQGLVMFDAQRRLIFCNSSYATMYGMTPESLQPGIRHKDVIGRRIANGIYAGDSPQAYMQERAEWGENPSEEGRIYSLNDGRVIANSRRLLPTGGWIATHEDISALAHVRNALRQSESRFKDIAEMASDWFWETDADHRVTYVSDRFLEAAGIDPRFVLQKTYMDFCASSNESVRQLTADFAARRPIRDCMFESLDDDGEKRHFSISGKPIFDGEGTFLGFRGSGRDRTAEEDAKRALERSHEGLQEEIGKATADLRLKTEQLEQALEKEKQLVEMQRQFVSMASHEFRTPLSIISGSAQRLEREKDGIKSDYLLSKTATIRGAVERMLRLMESTLSLAQLDEGKVQVYIEPCEIGPLIEKICAAHQEIASSHRIICRLGELPEMIDADSVAVEQMLGNLLSNAVKYAPDAPDIEVSAELHDNCVDISVRDYGLGIDADDLANMFTRFFRAGTSTGIAGTGIGLYLVKTLVELHAGSVIVESTKDQGSVFTLRLPVSLQKTLEEVVTAA